MSAREDHHRPGVLPRMLRDSSQRGEAIYLPVIGGQVFSFCSGGQIYRLGAAATHMHQPF